ncbi:hypothetical protein KI387_035216 [Taxus chinensis]|uniref:Uncharacterized protein n=1 Tax=Taxus chinensis TaxID=29808 RepID=A0AA38FP21_TAXCH|nr:hypothetical protein KI387_035216 [Taxus chinensis]
MIAMCLVKDQTKRPTAEKLLKHSFFKQAKSPEYVVRNLLQGLPPLWDRVKALQLKDSAQLALKRMPSAEQEALSQSEYKRGVSAWNFDIEDLKAQAALMQDDDDTLGGKEEDDTSGPSMKKSPSKSLETSISSDTKKVKTEQRLPLMQSSSINELSNFSDLKIQGRKETKEIEFANGDTNITNPDRHGDLRLLDSSKIDDREQQKNFYKDRQSNNGTSVRKTFELEQVEVTAERSHARPSHQAHSGPLMIDRMLGYEREKNGRNLAEPFKQDLRKDPVLSGPLMLSNRASTNSLSAPLRSSGGFKDYQEDKSKAGVVQKKGRFSVTSEDVDLVENVHLPSVSRRPSQSIALRKSASVGDWLSEQKPAPVQLPKDPVSSTIPVAVITPHLHIILQQAINQEELLVSLLTSLQQTEAGNPGQQPGKWSSQSRNGSLEPLVETAAEREQILLSKIGELQFQILSLTDELHAVRHKSFQLQRQLDAVYNREEEEKSQKDRKEKEDI